MFAEYRLSAIFYIYFIALLHYGTYFYSIRIDTSI
jgi:hypothetical protein